ncbi:MAG TPA: penicillin-binding protein 1C [Planctomycetota bacterium]|nr:penicillin-binding protein 1C [Planctomycetota bacterium]
MKSQAGRHRWRRKLCAIAFAALLLPKLGYGLLSLLFPFPEAYIERMANPVAAPRVLDRAGNALGAFVADDDTWSFPLGAGEGSARLRQAIVAVEDKRFYSHGGVDGLALGRAAWSNLSSGRIVSGASTLTMQTVRLLEPRRRTLWAKLVEAFRAWQLEGLRSKDEILAAYLNLAPFGGNLTGAEAASLAYFRKRASDLTLAEAALLAGLPQAPSRLRPDRFPERARARRNHVLGQMLACGFVTPGEFDAAAREPVSVRRRPFPARARHFTQLVRQRYPGRPALRTTLDPRVQHLAETALQDGVGALRPAGVSNGAIVVIENDAAAVRALVGSCDFFAEDDGQVNGATAPRSPGSALKPFTYALAFERGLCTPETILADVPASYSGYEPENYDRDYRGPVAARDALASSLNLPAVRLLRQVGHEALHAFLKQLGLSTLTREADHYGLALTLGAVEVTLLELTNAYATLARLGVHRPIRLLETEAVPDGQRVLSAGAAYLVADVLSDTARLGGRPLWKSPRAQARMAWKTGTSHGHRDAWTVAYTPRHTVGVWLGNFSGRPCRELIGLHAAAPIAARILDQLEADGPSAWFAMPDSVELRPLCATSGMVPGPHCGATTPGLALRAAGERTCTVHVAVKVDRTTGERLCPRCVAGREYVVRVVESWPAELAAWLRRHGRHDALPPPHNPLCATADAADAPPRILSPASGQSYILLPDAAHQRLSLQATSRAGVLYWFVNGTLLTTSAPLEPAFWALEPGTHTVLCADEAGRSASVTICVR